MLKPFPLRFAWETVTLDGPEFVSVSEMLFELPVCTVPKVKVDGLGLSVPAGNTPVPPSDTVKLGLDPEDVMVILPLDAPAALGVNFTVNVVLWPGLRVRGRVSPLEVNPAPVIVAFAIVRLDPPELLKV
jgi:hypothetical protein